MTSNSKTINILGADYDLLSTQEGAPALLAHAVASDIGVSPTTLTKAVRAAGYAVPRSADLVVVSGSRKSRPSVIDLATANALVTYYNEDGRRYRRVEALAVLNDLRPILEGLQAEHDENLSLVAAANKAVEPLMAPSITMVPSLVAALKDTIGEAVRDALTGLRVKLNDDDYSTIRHIVADELHAGLKARAGQKATAASEIVSELNGAPKLGLPCLEGN